MPIKAHLKVSMYLCPEATHEASQGPLKGAVSAQKAIQGSETKTRELLGGTEEITVSPTGGHDCKSIILYLSGPLIFESLRPLLLLRECLLLC